MNYKLVILLQALNALVGECKQGSRKCCKESILDENSITAPKFELLLPLLWPAL